MNVLTSHHVSQVSCPLYLYENSGNERRKRGSSGSTALSLFEGLETYQTRQPNLSQAFIAAVKNKLGLGFVPDGRGDLGSSLPAGGEGGGRGQGTFGPEDIFHYAYAVFHSPTYRQRYAEFLKIDFPRLPLTSDVDLFRSLCALGEALVALHLLESPAVNDVITSYPVAGDDRVISAHPKYTPPTDDQPGRVYINKKQYFEGVPPEVWEFQIGGYQVLHKWLKDRKKRTLSYDELEHYQKIVVALQKTMDLMEAIDETIPEFPIS
jgi:hypothetical protein